VDKRHTKTLPSDTFYSGFLLGHGHYGSDIKNLALSSVLINQGHKAF